MHWPRGKVLGGPSSINGMLYVRGNPADYDSWAQMGCRGWTYDEVLPSSRGRNLIGRGDGIPREGRAAEGRGLPHDPSVHPPLRRGRAAGRLPFHPRLQRQDPGRRRLFADDAQGQVSRFDAQTVPPKRGGPIPQVQTTRSPPGCCSRENAARGEPFAGAAGSAGVRVPRMIFWAGPSTRRMCCIFRASVRPIICNRSASRWCTNCPGSAPTSSTITRFASRTG